MIKKLKTLLFILTTLLCVTLTSCEDSGTIKGYDREMLDIVTYANNTEVKGGFTFTASESWSTIVDYGTPLRSDNGWITLDPASGNAGKVTINITLDENLTGEDRSATIRIICGETTLEINIVQRGTENTNNDGTQDNDSTGNEPSIRQPIYVIDRIIQTIDKSGMTVAYTYSFEREDEIPGSRITKVRIDGLPREDGAATVYDAYLEYHISYDMGNIEIESYANGYLYQTIFAVSQGQYIDEYSYSEGIQMVNASHDGKEGTVYDGIETHTYYFNRHDHNDQLYRTNYVCNTEFEGYGQYNTREEIAYNLEWESADIKGGQDVFNHAYNLTHLSWMRYEQEENHEYFSYYSDLNASYTLPEVIPTAPGSFIDINHMISTFWLEGIYEAYGEQQGILGLIGLIAPPSCNLISDISYTYGEWHGSPVHVEYKLSNDQKRIASFTMASDNSSAVVKIEYLKY